MYDDHEDVVEVLANFKRLSDKKRRKFVTNLLLDQDFMKWLFQPEKTANLTQQVEELYRELTKTSVMEAILDMLEYEGCTAFSRSHATFITTICNMGIAKNVEELKAHEKARKDPTISRTKIRDWADKIDRSNSVITKLLKRARKIVKREAKSTAREARLPLYITQAAYTSIPDPKYVDRYKIGFYLNNLLNTIYSDVEENGEFIDDVKWRKFFADVFGKNNVVECATFILLEGVHRIDKYRNSEDVTLCWDTLTEFALNELNNSPDNTREQMVELYVKRLDKMFSNKSFDLRTNLLEIPKTIWPGLWKTVQKYSGKLLEVLNRNFKSEDEE